ncbi:hypothetical protein MBLNU459_g7582t3 [Dothideomycetes sp. NU459]
MFRKQDLPPDQARWPDIFRGVIGSPDPNGRQLDGMGGGISSLSKICIVGPTSHPEADVDYTFAAIGVRDSEVDFSSNCGNMTSAIGPFAVDSGLVEAQQGETEKVVRIHNTNTGKIIHSAFPVEQGAAVAHGSFAIDGVAGTAAKIRLAFMNPAGSKTGKLMPTGKIVDTFDGIDTTCVDVGNPCVFVQASDLGVPGGILPDSIESHPDLLRRLDSIRRQASVAMAISSDTSSAPGSIPKIAMVSPPHPHTLLSGEAAQESDLVVRALSVGQPHRAVPITVALALAAASKIRGSVVERNTRTDPVDPDGVTIGHSSGRLLVSTTFDENNQVKYATVFRTARRLMEGTVFWK